MSDSPSFELQLLPSTAHLAIPAQTYLSQHQKGHASVYLATGAIVFSASRVLLLQRAPGDSMPNLWETPGGACDPEDNTILHAVARELWEETKLVATSIGPMVGQYTFNTRSGKSVQKLSFVVQVARHDDHGDSGVEVRLQPDEHQDFLWATEEEVGACKVGDMDIPFTKPEQQAVVLDAFTVLKAENGA